MSGAGGVVVLRGGASGLTGAGATGADQNTAGVPDVAETGADWTTRSWLQLLTRPGFNH
ncbi:hypothetical protein ACFYNL_09515 [Streptomyces sp. NPDC007808]|uniref:hypothetical protein n=1 Tax=Streptomyces sp. NPDC007808 TaxID=3364779 RepID=UPI0036BE41F9